MFLPLSESEVRWRSHRGRRPAAGQHHCVCRLCPLRQRHPGGPQHRNGPQLLHAGPCEYLWGFVSVKWGVFIPPSRDLNVRSRGGKLSSSFSVSFLFYCYMVLLPRSLFSLGKPINQYYPVKTPRSCRSVWCNQRWKGPQTHRNSFLTFLSWYFLTHITGSLSSWWRVCSSIPFWRIFCSY